MQNLHFWLCFHLRTGLRHHERADTKAGTIGTSVHGRDVLPSVVHVRNAESASSVTVFLDLLHCKIVHFGGCVAKAGHAQL
jgi:hypothetical protein